MLDNHRPPHIWRGELRVVVHRHSEVGSDQFHVSLLCHRTSQYTGHGGGSEYAPLPPSSLGVGSECLLARAAWLWLNATYSIFYRTPRTTYVVGYVPLGLSRLTASVRCWCLKRQVDWLSMRQ